MPAIQVVINTRDFEAGLRQIKAKAPRAVVRALNRAATTARTYMVRTVAKDMGLKNATVAERITQRDAKADSFTATVTASGRRIPLSQFSAKGPVPSRGKRGGVSARIGAKGRTKYPHAFIATMHSGHVGVFQRVPNAQRRGPRPNRSQLPIYELFGPSVGLVFNAHLDEGIARARESFLKNIESEIKFATTRT